ncbi:MAG: SGNH/GDSL hydrolase family protein [Myxococcales bacterium]|nr:SGNH/GDSL hydrolase family protein [Myxococcales bacterium]
MGFATNPAAKRVALAAYALVVCGLIVYLGRKVWQRAQYSTATRALVTPCTPDPFALGDATRYHHVNSPCDRFVDQKFIVNGSVSSSEYQVDIAINSLGFRNDEYTVQKPAGVTRVVLLGDSFVYGLGVRHEETFYERLETKLNAAGSRKYEVWNVAAVSWASYVQLRIVEQQLPGFSPDLLVLFFDDSDFYDNEVYRRLEGPGGNFRGDGDMEEFWKLREQVIAQAWRHNADGGVADARDAGADGAASFPSFAELRARSAGDIEAMAAKLRASSVPFLVVTYPYPGFTEQYQKEELRPLYARLEAQAIAHISLYDLFPVDTHSRFYFKGNRHWNAAGSQRVADALELVLRERYPALFPPPGSEPDVP